MQTRSKSVVAAVALAIAGVGVGATVASAAASSNNSPAAEPTGTYVFACVNRIGQVAAGSVRVTTRPPPGSLRRGRDSRDKLAGAGAADRPGLIPVSHAPGGK
jgi:hypothetical protein